MGLACLPRLHSYLWFPSLQLLFSSCSFSQCWYSSPKGNSHLLGAPLLKTSGFGKSGDLRSDPVTLQPTSGFTSLGCICKINTPNSRAVLTIRAMTCLDAFCKSERTCKLLLTKFSSSSSCRVRIKLVRNCKSNWMKIWVWNMTQGWAIYVGKTTHVSDNGSVCLSSCRTSARFLWNLWLGFGTCAVTRERCHMLNILRQGEQWNKETQSITSPMTTCPPAGEQTGQEVSMSTQGTWDCSVNLLTL